MEIGANIRQTMTSIVLNESASPMPSGAAILPSDFQTKSMDAVLPSGEALQDRVSLSAELATLDVIQTPVYDKFVPQTIQTLAFEDAEDSVSINMLSIINKQPGGQAPFYGREALYLADLVSMDEKSFSQSARTYSFFTSGPTLSETISMSDFQSTKSTASTNLDVSFTTKDGDKVSFTLSYEEGFGSSKGVGAAAYTGLSISYSLDGELSEEEQEQFVKFSEALNRMAADYLNRGEASFDALNFSDYDIFSEINLNLTGGREASEYSKFELHYQEDDQERRLSFNLNGDLLELSVDKTELAMGWSSTQPQRSMAQYLELLDGTVQDAQGSDEQAKLIKTAFVSLQGQQAPLTQLDPIDNPKLKPVHVDKLMLTGLDDFSLSFQSNYSKFKEHRVDELFSINASQDTSLREQGAGNRRIDQYQQLELKTQYYRPVGLMEKPDFETDSFIHVKFERKLEALTSIEFDDHMLVEAKNTQTLDESKTDTEFSFGKVVDRHSEGTNKAIDNDFVTQLKQESNFELLSLIDKIGLGQPFSH